MSDLLPVVQSGDRRAALEAIRDRLAAEIDAGEASPRDVAALSKQLAEIVREIDNLPAAKGASPVDDLASRRAARRAEAAAPKRAAAGDKRRSGSGGTRRKRGSES